MDITGSISSFNGIEMAYSGTEYTNNRSLIFHVKS